MGMLQVQKNRTFQDSVKSTLPLLASSMFMADLSMGIISHPYIFREDTGQMTENTLKQHRIGNLKIFTNRQRSISHRNWSYCFLWTSVVFLVWDTGLVWCLFFPSEAQWVDTPVRTFSKWRCCLWLKLCIQHGHHQLMVTESLSRWVSTGVFKPKHHSHASRVIPGLVYVTGFDSRKPPIVFQKRFVDAKNIKLKLVSVPQIIQGIAPLLCWWKQQWILPAKASPVQWLVTSFSNTVPKHGTIALTAGSLNQLLPSEYRRWRVLRKQ